MLQIFRYCGTLTTRAVGHDGTIAFRDSTPQEIVGCSIATPEEQAEAARVLEARWARRAGR